MKQQQSSLPSLTAMVLLSSYLMEQFLVAQRLLAPASWSWALEPWLLAPEPGLREAALEWWEAVHRFALRLNWKVLSTGRRSAQSTRRSPKMRDARNRRLRKRAHEC